MTARFPTFYLTHGGGPWPYMSGEARLAHRRLEESLRELPRQLPRKPDAILVVSGHWEERDFAVMGAAVPDMIYDFGGFPEELYRIRYPAAGSPRTAERALALIQQAKLPAHLDPGRGFDHGTYSLLAVCYPQADVPVFQVSLRADYDPQAHLQLGRALAPLRDEGILIIGSGSSYHNLRRFFERRGRGQDSEQFDAWLRETLLDCRPAQRSQRLLEWARAPAAREAHPREDHLMPLHVVVGAAEEEPGRVIYAQEDFLGTIALSSYRFG
ncbi:MAG TPA: class III extradiol ring-cleavage dioxygenase [Steroidobacteraceae bacterium]|nr:class III extradiol ring-cleavage dioxygenase [Steroidobacteraceae bacterium]